LSDGRGMMRTITYGGHTIQLPGMSQTGKEGIRYDGRVVSSKHSMVGSTHIFSVTENGEELQCEVEIGLRWHGLSGWYTVRRNGKVIYTDR